MIIYAKARPSRFRNSARHEERIDYAPVLPLPMNTRDAINAGVLLGVAAAMIGAVSMSVRHNGQGSIERERCSGHGTRTKRAIVEPRRAVLQPFDVAQNHLDVRQQPVRNQHRLCPLHMRITRHHRVVCGTGSIEQCIAPRGQRMNDEANLLTDVKTQICGDLFIAATPGVKFQPKRSDALHQRKLDKVMNVFCRRMIAHQRLTLFRLKLCCHGIQRIAQFCCFTCREDSRGGKR